jgi:hypothetical protein
LISSILPVMKFLYSYLSLDKMLLMVLNLPASAMTSLVAHAKISQSLLPLSLWVSSKYLVGFRGGSTVMVIV